jgi:hypothetical protein
LPVPQLIPLILGAKKQAVEILETPTVLSGEDVLDGFHLNIGKIWG